MSETHDGNTGWQVTDGDVVPPADEPDIIPQQPYINRAEMGGDPEFDARQVAVDAVDPAKGITREQARRLNQAAEDERGGKKLGVDPSDPNTEVPGKHGRSNWQR